jgi:hypothetical protein
LHDGSGGKEIGTMYVLKLATFAVLGMTSVAALAQAQTMSGSMHASTPMSSRASNITPADTRSTIAPALPTPMVGADAGPNAYLKAAHDALVAGRTGEAQQSLEMAETRQLARVVSPDQASSPDPDPAVTQIQNALQSLGDCDRGHALQIIDAMAR